MKKTKLLSSLVIIFLCTTLLSFKQLKVYAISTLNGSNDNIDTAESINLNSPVSGALSDYRDVAYYKFTLSDDGNAEVVFTHNLLPGKTDTLWEIDILDSNERNYQTLYSEGNEPSSTASVGLPKGTYYIEVSAYDYTDEVKNSYNVALNFTQSNYYEKEFNDNIDLPNTIELGATYTGSLRSRSDLDFYCFDSDADGNVQLKFQHDLIPGDDNNEWKIDIIDYRGNIYKSIYSQGNDIKNTCSVGLPKGHYYIEVSSEGYDKFIDMPYKLTASLTKSPYYEKEFNDNMDLPNTMELNKYYGGNISNGNDEDYYTFTLSSAGRVDLNFKHDKIPGNSDKLWKVSIINKNGDVLQYFYSLGNSIKTSSFVGLPKGKYYVHVEGYYSSELYSSIYYKVGVSFKKSNSYEKEFNDNTDLSNPLSNNKSLTGCLSSSYDTDYYSFKVSKKRTVKLNFTHEFLSGESDTVWYIKLYNNKGSEMYHFYSYGNKSSLNQSVKLSKGKYFISISPWSDDSLDLKYTIKIK